MFGLRRDVLLLAPSSSLHQHDPSPPSAALGFSLGVFPFLTATAPPLVTASTYGGSIEEFANPNNLLSLNSANRRQEEQVEGENRLKITSVCDDCGNRAKKGCNYGRCRTCCRSRRYDCATHVQSTWIPASSVRGGNAGGSPESSFGAKRPKLDAEMKEKLPGKVQAPAEFRCIRVTTINGEEAKFAYQVTVKINGHVFKGLLYDHGVDHKNAFPCVS